MSLEGEEICFVGDAYALDVEGAVNAGWNAVWMNRRGRKIPGDAVKPGRENERSMVSVESEEDLRNFIIRILRGDAE